MRDEAVAASAAARPGRSSTRRRRAARRRSCAALERLGDDRRRDFDQPAQDRLLADDLRVVLDVRRRRHRVDEKADVVLAARAPRARRARLSSSDERERIDDAAALGDRDHRAEDPAMPLRVEHRVVDVLDRAHHRVLVDQHRRRAPPARRPPSTEDAGRGTDHAPAAAALSSIRRASWTSSQVGRFQAGFRRSAAGWYVTTSGTP